MKNNGVVKEYFDNPRDYDYEKVCGAAGSDFPSYYMIPEENMGTQKNQGDVGACVAETIVQIAEEWWKRQFGKQEEHSEGYVYGALRSEKSIGYGMAPTLALQYWMEKGTVPKSYFDILVEMPEMKNIVYDREDLAEIAKRYRLKGFVKISGSNRDNQVKDALMKYQYGLVSAGGGHCMQLVGWDDEKDKYICRDSYGYAKDGGNGYNAKKKSNIDEIYLPLFEDFDIPFTDVSKDAWYYNNVRNLYFAGLMSGTSETTFEPDKMLTRAEAAALIDRLYSNMVNMFRTSNLNINEKLDLLENKLS